MLSGEALDVAFILRARIGPLAHGEGPTVELVRSESGLAAAQFARALDELQSVGFVAINAESADGPAITVLPPLQIYLDDLENQGTDDY
jgi:hypothetical protein